MSRKVARLAVSSTIALLAMSLLSWTADRACAGENEIERLARIHFPKMQPTECETNLLEHVSIGEVAYCGSTHSEKDQAPADTGKKGTQFDVDAKLIRWLCTDPAATKLVDPRGIRLHAARVVGQLDLTFVTVAFPLAFENSRFTTDINLGYSRLANFVLTGGQILGITANNMTVRGDFVLSNTVSAEDGVYLDEASLGGDLSCDGGTFKNPGKYALRAENLKANRVSLSNDFSAEGEVDLSGANLGGDLIAEGGTFKNPGNYALKAENLKAADVFLNDHFSADGEVDLLGATLGGDLDGDAGAFKSPSHTALWAEGLRAANVFLRNGFRADGRVDLSGATLSGDFDGDGGTFKNPGYLALNAEHLKAARVFLRHHFSADGEVDLLGATLDGVLDAEGGTFKNPGDLALNAETLKAANVFLGYGFSAEGTVDFVKAHIEGAFNWTDLAHTDADKVSLDLDSATVGSLFDDEASWPRQGNLNLDGFVYGRFGGGPVDVYSRLSWLDRQGPGNFTRQPFEQLAKVLRENGEDADARRVLVAMEQSRYGNEFLERCWSFILRQTIGYGYDIWRSLKFIGGFVILGTFLFFWGYKSEAITQIDKEKPDHFLSFNPFVYSLESFLPLVDLHQAKYWGPDPELRQLLQPRPRVPVAAFRPLSKYELQFGPAFGKHLRWYLWLHIMAGWFFTSMLIAGITGLAQKG